MATANFEKVLTQLEPVNFARMATANFANFIRKLGPNLNVLYGSAR